MQITSEPSALQYRECVTLRIARHRAPRVSLSTIDESHAAITATVGVAMISKQFPSLLRWCPQRTGPAKSQIETAQRLFVHAICSSRSLAVVFLVFPANGRGCSGCSIGAIALKGRAIKARYRGHVARQKGRNA